MSSSSARLLVDLLGLSSGNEAANKKQDNQMSRALSLGQITPLDRVRSVPNTSVHMQTNAELTDHCATLFCISVHRHALMPFCQRG